MKTAEEYYDLGLSHSKSNPEKAIEYYQKAIGKHKDYINAYNAWGNVLLKLEKYDEAREKYNKCLEIDPNYVYAYYNLGLSYENDNPQKAIKYYQTTLEKDNFYADAYYAWGNVLFNLGKYDEAREKYNKCLEIDPGYNDAYYAIGRSYKTSNADTAIAYFRKTIAKDANYIDAYNAWGNVLLDLGEYDKAREKYNKCLEADTNYIHAYYNLGRSYEKSDSEKAIEYYQKAIEKDKAYIDAYISWGNILLDKEEYDKAREKYNQSLKLDPKYKLAYHNLAVSFLKQDPIKAISYYEKIIELDPEDDNAYNNIYACISLLNDNGEHIKKFDDLVKEKNSAQGFHALGNLYQYLLKDYDLSLQWYDKSRSLGEVKDISLDISNLHDSRSDLEKSLEILNDALKRNPGKMYLLHNKAHYLFKMGHYRESRELWEEVLLKYEEAIKKETDLKKNSNNYLYYGIIHYEIFADIEKAENILVKGLDLDKKNLAMLAALSKLYLEKDRLSVHTDLSTYWKRNTNLKTAETIFKKPFKHEEDHYNMAELYMVEEMHKKAHSIINDYLEDGLLSARWSNLRGQLYMAEEEYKKAIQAFKKAIKHEAHNLNLYINLGNAYLMEKKYVQAEMEFKKILQKDPNKVDAYIGLGEIELNRSSENTDDTSLNKAEKHFLDAIRLGKSEKGSKRLNLNEPTGKKKERIYKDLKLSNLYYSMGYIKTKQYEKNKFKFGYSYLNDGLSFFTKSLQSDPDNLKAASAKRKIEGQIKPNRKAAVFETFGAWFITGLALLLFLFCQYSFYFGPNDPKKYSLNENGVEYLSSVLPVTEIQTKNLKKLNNITFKDRNTLLAAIGTIIGQERLNSKREFVNNIDLSVTGPENNIARVPPGYYTLISFGSILFMIAGLYLPKLLKLKVGVIELEKNSPSEIHEISLVGIQK